MDRDERWVRVVSEANSEQAMLRANSALPVAGSRSLPRLAAYRDVRIDVEIR
jgi:hypothetical protein